VKTFEGRTVLGSLDLSIAQGEFFALLGPSGSGKSTLLRIISGVDTPDRGEVRLRGQDLRGVPAYRRPVHTVFQSYALFPHLTVAGNVGFPLRVAGVPRPEQRQRVAQALAWVKLDDFASRRIQGLSGGERQRVALARALVDGPQCVLLDEPLAALDPHLRDSTLELIKDIQARLPITYMYVTHDRREALRAAHRIGVLREGRLEQVGSPEALYQHPRSAFVASFIGAINWLPGEVISEAGQIGVRFDGGAWAPLAGQVLPPSRRVVVGLRPEDLRIGGEGFLAAQVVSSEFCGSSVWTRLRTPQGLSLSAETRDRPAAVGESVRVGWALRAAHVFAADEGPLATCPDVTSAPAPAP
jgi:ABC-type Fe3+/spermidine/putrescine transport system ATPase subunit